MMMTFVSLRVAKCTEMIHVVVHCVQPTQYACTLSASVCVGGHAHCASPDVCYAIQVWDRPGPNAQR